MILHGIVAKTCPCCKKQFNAKTGEVLEKEDLYKVVCEHPDKSTPCAPCDRERWSANGKAW